MKKNKKRNSIIVALTLAVAVISGGSYLYVQDQNAKEVAILVQQQEEQAAAEKAEAEKAAAEKAAAEKAAAEKVAAEQPKPTPAPTTPAPTASEQPAQAKPTPPAEKPKPAEQAPTYTNTFTNTTYLCDGVGSNPSLLPPTDGGGWCWQRLSEKWVWSDVKTDGKHGQQGVDTRTEEYVLGDHPGFNAAGDDDE